MGAQPHFAAAQARVWCYKYVRTGSCRSSRMSESTQTYPHSISKSVSIIGAPSTMLLKCCWLIDCSRHRCITFALPGRLGGEVSKAGAMCSRSRQLWCFKLCGGAGLCGLSWQGSTEQPCACKPTGGVLSAGGSSEHAGQPPSRSACPACVDAVHHGCRCSRM